MITELTPEQVAKFPQYVDKWVKIGTNTEPIDMIECVRHIKDAYGKANIPAPEYFIGPVAGPFEGAVAEAVLGDFAKRSVEFRDAGHLNELVLAEVERLLPQFANPDKSKRPNMNLSIANQIYGNQEYWLSYYDYFIIECGLDLNLIQPLIDLAKNCGWWTPLKNVAIIQQRPKELHLDDRGRLHNPNGAAVNYGNNSLSNVYAVGGVRVSRNVVDRNYTWQDIDNESNAEVRRVMIELYGQDKYIIDSGAEIVNQDDFGTLYRKEIPGDEPLMMVKVVNSTMEPDGSYKDYFIRVDPQAYGGLKTARAAVASTWRNRDAERTLMFKRPEDYDPDIET